MHFKKKIKKKYIFCENILLCENLIFVLISYKYLYKLITSMILIIGTAFSITIILINKIPLFQ